MSTASGANDPRRPSAISVTAFAEPSYGSKVAVIRSPTGNIICDFAQDDSYAGCGVESMIDADAGVKWWVDISGARPERIFRQDAPFSGSRNGDVQVVEYGTAVTTGHYACESEHTGMTCWNTQTGHGAHLARKGIDLITKPVGDLPATSGDSEGGDSEAAAAGDGDYEAVLSAPVPAGLVPNNRAGRLKDGVYEDFDPEIKGEMVWLKNTPEDTGWKQRVSFVDVAGDSRKETVALLGRTNGGVSWPDGVVVYNPEGRIIWWWDTGDAGGDPRGGSEFQQGASTSVDVTITGTSPSAGGADQSGTSTYRLSKGPNAPMWSLVSRSGS